jgi:hypothetical protein
MLASDVMAFQDSNRKELSPYPLAEDLLTLRLTRYLFVDQSLVDGNLCSWDPNK